MNEQPEYRHLTGAELDTICQRILDSLPSYKGSTLKNPYIMVVHAEGGFQSVSNLSTDEFRRFVRRLADGLDQEPTDLGSYKPPSIN